MITYSIISRRSPPPTSSRSSPANPDTPEGQLTIFRRATKLAKKVFSKGTRVQLIGTNRTGSITYIHYDIHAIAWKSGKPYFIEVLMDGEDQSFLCSVSSLKRIK